MMNKKNTDISHIYMKHLKFKTKPLQVTRTK